MGWPSSILTHKIEFIKKVVTTSDSGYSVKGETESHQFYAKANKYVRTRVLNENDYGLNVKAIVEWKTRYKAGVTEEMAIKYDNQYYRINSVIEVGRKDGLIIETVAIKYDEL